MLRDNTVWVYHGTVQGKRGNEDDMANLEFMLTNGDCDHEYMLCIFIGISKQPSGTHP